MAEFQIRMDLKSIKRQVLDRQQVMNRFDKAAIVGLRRFGGFTRSVIRRSMKKGGQVAPRSRWPNELKALIGNGRDSAGKFQGAGELDILPRPRIASRRGRPPRYRQTRLLKDKIFFIVATTGRSVVIGPQVWGMHDPAGTLEHGGEIGGPLGYRREWVAWWDGGKRKIRLVAKGGRRIRIKPRPYVEPAYDLALDSKVPGLWQDSI
jgi:hypothetical protein